MENEIKTELLLKNSAINVNSTYTYASNNLFYACVNPTYYDYYFRIVRRCAQWLDGYVFDFHDADNGIFSTRLALALVNGLSSQLTGKTIMFRKGNKETPNETLSFMSSEWSKKTKFVDTIKKGIKFSMGVPTSLLKLNKTSDGNLWLEALRGDFFFYETDFRGNLCDITCFIKSYVDTNDTTKNYFIVEHRYYKEYTKEIIKEIGGDKVKFETKALLPSVEYQVHSYIGTSLMPSMASSKTQLGLEWQDIPRNVRNKIKDDYNAFRVNEPKALPFEDLGCELLKFGGEDITVPTAQFGGSIIEMIISELMEYDLAFSWAIRDRYNGKGMVAVPKTLSQGSLTGNGVGGSTSALKGLEISKFEQIPSANPDKDRPFNYQFDLRVDEWAKAQDNCLRKIATKIGLSARVLASYLDNDGASKTATEMEQDSDSVSSWVEENREYYEKPINNIINTVIKFYGLKGKIEIKFATPSIVNKDLVIARAIKKYMTGLQNLEDTLKEIFPDLDDEQIQIKIKNAKERQEELRQNVEQQQLQEQVEM